LRDSDTVPAVITGLDPVIQTLLRLDPGCLGNLNEIRALLDCRVKPGNDGEGDAKTNLARSELNRTAVGSTGRSRALSRDAPAEPWHDVGWGRRDQVSGVPGAFGATAQPKSPAASTTAAT